MEHQPTRRCSSDLDQSALVALQQAAMDVPSPGLSGHSSDGRRIIAGFESLATIPAQGDDVFRIAGTSPGVLSQWTPGHEEYSPNPRFLESQRELRDLLLTSAQSVAPTRAASPIGRNAAISDSHERPAESAIRSIVSTEERVVWLRNYLDEVAPWVSQ